MSSSTKMNTSSMSAREQAASSTTSQPRWRSCGSRPMRSGRSSNRGVTVQGPSARNSSRSPSGSVPLRSTWGAKRSPMRQPAAGASAGTPVGAVETVSGSAAGAASPDTIACRVARMCAPARWSAVSGRSISARIWSLASSATPSRRSSTATSPWRTRSKAVSKSWVKAATASKPNIAPDPLIVCRARKAASTSARSFGVCPRSSSVPSRLSRSSAASCR